jgi:hypothetical protein
MSLFWLVRTIYFEIFLLIRRYTFITYGTVSLLFANGLSSNLFCFSKHARLLNYYITHTGFEISAYGHGGTDIVTARLLTLMRHGPFAPFVTTSTDTPPCHSTCQISDYVIMLWNVIIKKVNAFRISHVRQTLHLRNLITRKQFWIL